MTRQQLDSQAEYLTETLQRIRSVGLNAEMYSRVRGEVESDPRFKTAPSHVREEIEAALVAKAFSIGKLRSV